MKVDTDLYPDKVNITFSEIDTRSLLGLIKGWFTGRSVVMVWETDSKVIKRGIHETITYE